MIFFVRNVLNSFTVWRNVGIVVYKLGIRNMISVYQLKSDFQKLLRPISDKFAAWGLTANMITLSALALSAAVGGAVYFMAPQNVMWLGLLPIALFIRMALNAIDGMMAREHNQQTALGAILNELGDIVSDVIIYVPFLWVMHCLPAWIFLFTILTIISETVGIIGVQIGASRRYDGPMGKSDRAFWCGLAATLAACGFGTDKYARMFAQAMCFLLLYTIINRICGALKEVKTK